ncbi:hypothetical protein HYU50_01060 [Candidatus Woesearchaeota archaeon]|nr:hypothetical protein [Candidatus Woesearchaeota archaeon]
MSKKPSFTNVNYSVCMYCSNLMIFDPRVARTNTDSTYGCKIEKDGEGKYQTLVRFEKPEDELSVLEKGCNNFKSSGLPAHPRVLKELLEINPRTKSIPSDTNTTETSWDFGAKVKKYTPKENFLRSIDEIQF